MGTGCQYDCVHGTEVVPFSVNCVCDPCYDDEACLVECGGHGSCMNKTCQCEAGYKGDYCRELDCPGKAEKKKRKKRQGSSYEIMPMQYT